VLQNKQTWSDNRILHMNAWQWKANQFLARRGIYPGESNAAGALQVDNYRARFDIPSTVATLPPAPPRPAPAPPQAPVGVAPVAPVSETPTHSVVKVASALARAYRVEVQNNLAKGGAFWVLERDAKSRLGRELARIQMSFNADRGFWIK